MIFAFSLVFLGFMFTQPARGDTGYCNCDEFGVKECEAVNSKLGDSAFCKKDGESCVSKPCADYAEEAKCKGRCYWKGATSKCVEDPADCTGHTFDVTPITEAMCTAVGCSFDATGVKCAKNKVQCSEYGQSDCPSYCIFKDSCKPRDCPNLDETACKLVTTKCKWGTACVALTCADVLSTCDGTSLNTDKVCNLESAASCVEVDRNSDCTAFKGQESCKKGTKKCKWDTTCKQADCSILNVSQCELPRFFTIGGTAVICKKVDAACAAGAATDLTELTCAINNDYSYAWKDGSCQLCEGAKPPGENNATIFALGVLSILALSF